MPICEVGIVQHQLQFANDGAAADRRQIGAFHLAPAVNHVAGGTLSVAKEESLTRRHVTGGLGIERRHG